MSTRIIAVLGVRKTIFLSQLIIIARLGSYVFLSLGVYWALVGELLQGLCFGLFWSAAVKSISDKAPEEYQVNFDLVDARLMTTHNESIGIGTGCFGCHLQRCWTDHWQLFWRCDHGQWWSLPSLAFTDHVQWRWRILVRHHGECQCHARTVYWHLTQQLGQCAHFTGLFQR